MDPAQRTPTFAEVLRKTFGLMLLDVHTAFVVAVDSYDPVKQTIDCTPQVQHPTRQENGTFQPQPIPRLSKVPVAFPGAGGFRITLPITQGDTMFVVCAESSLDVWQQNGGVVDPKDQRRFHLSDAVAIAGIRTDANPWTGASTSAITIGKDGGPQLVLRGTTIELGGDDQNPPGDNLALASLVKAEIGKVRDSLATLTDAFNAHGHSVTVSTSTGKGATDAMIPPTPVLDPAAVSDVKSTIVLAK